jgi:RHS repeat-associated protein
VQGPAGPVAEVGGGGSYPLADTNGSVTTVTDASGNVAGRTSYDPFGVVRSTTGTSSAFGYTGGEATGDLVHLPARDLAPELGRFLSVDPVRPGAPGVVGWNPYTYVANNPVTWNDPSGAFQQTPTQPKRGLGGGPAGEYIGIVSSISVRAIPGIKVIGWSVLQRFGLMTALVGLGTLSCSTVCATAPAPDVVVEDDEEVVPVPEPDPENETDDDDRDRGCLYGAPWAEGAHYYWPLDGRRRATGAEACLKTGDTSGGTDPGVNPVDWPGWHDGAGNTWNRGHLIAKSLGGRGIRRNLVPLYEGPNQGIMKAFEATVKGILDPVDPTYYSSFPVYPGSSGIPRGISLSFAKYGGPAGAISILNVPW